MKYEKVFYALFFLMLVAVAFAFDMWRWQTFLSETGSDMSYLKWLLFSWK